MTVSLREKLDSLRASIREYDAALSKRRRELEEELLSSVRRFESETGARVRSTDFVRADVTTHGDDEKRDELVAADVVLDALT